MLVEIAIGDAYGAPFEFAALKYIKKYNKLKDYYKSNRINSIDNNGIGFYTDDTQMSIAISEHMLDDANPTSEYYIKYFKKTYKRDPIAGYSKRIKSALESTDYNSFLSFNGNYSSNGAVMRSIPIGLYSNIDEVIYRTVAHTTSSHCNPNAIDAACIISLSSHYFYYNIGNKNYLIKWLSNILGDRKVLSIIKSWNGEKIECDAYQTASSVIKCLLASNSMKRILKECINFTGDVDSVAALTMGLSSLCKEIKNDLPVFLYDKLRNDKYGKDYLINLDNKLFNKYKI